MAPLTVIVFPFDKQLKDGELIESIVREMQVG
jgi:hypothetical protein